MSPSCRPVGRVESLLGQLAACVALLVCAAAPARAFQLDLSDRTDGTSCAYFNVGLLLAWPGGKPAWADARGAVAGSDAFAVQSAESGDPRRAWRWDATALVKGWVSGQWRNDGLLLLVQAGVADFHSRESADIGERPALALKFNDGSSQVLEPVADAALDCSTYTGQGSLPNLLLHDHSYGALRFDLTKLRAGQAAQIRSAELLLVRVNKPNYTRIRVALMRLVSPMGGPSALRDDGLAKAFVGDKGIASHPDVLYADGFDSGRIGDAWTGANQVRTAVVDNDEPRLFWPLAGKALRVTIPRGQSLGLDMRYKFKARHGREPDEVYFRYYLRLADDWLQAAEGGKLPGLAGTYGVAGWGGRPWGGDKGWSMRGSYGQAVQKGHPAAGRVAIGTYAYHSEADLTYGEGLPWMLGPGAGLLEPNQWYCIEQYVKLNTPRQKDGVLRTWVNGRLAFERSNLRVRDLPDIRIEEVWMNFFHGGTKTAVVDMNAYIDGVVIAKSYIGPMKLP